jgi:hypothetical protein
MSVVPSLPGTTACVLQTNQCRNAISKRKVYHATVVWSNCWIDPNKRPTERDQISNLVRSHALIGGVN